MIPLTATVQINVCTDGMVDWPQSHNLQAPCDWCSVFSTFLNRRTKIWQY